MKGVVFRGDRKVELVDVPDPEPGPGEAVIQITASGMCGTDLHQYRGPGRPAGSATIIGGHEPVGVVQAFGRGPTPASVGVGSRVMVHHYAGCGDCPDCRRGWPQMCTVQEPIVYGSNAHGSHAEYMVVSNQTLIPLRDDLTDETGAALSCGTGTAWGALNRLGDLGGRTISVFGQGPVGLSATLLAASRGARVIAFDLSATRLELARQAGASLVYDPTEVSAAQVIADATHGRGTPLALETSGSSAAAEALAESLSPRGVGCFVGIGATLDFEVRRYLRKQVTLLTAWTMSAADHIELADYIAENDIKVESMFTDRWSLTDAEQAYQLFDQQSTGKGVFVAV